MGAGGEEVLAHSARCENHGREEGNGEDVSASKGVVGSGLGTSAGGANEEVENTN